MARKRNEEYIGEDDDGEFEEEPFESYEDPPDFVDEITDEGSHESKMWKAFSRCNSRLMKKEFSEKCSLKIEEIRELFLCPEFSLLFPIIISLLPSNL